MKVFWFLIGSLVLPVFLYLTVSFGKLDLCWLTWDYLLGLTSKERQMAMFFTTVSFVISAGFTALFQEAYCD